MEEILIVGASLLDHALGSPCLGNTMQGIHQGGTNRFEKGKWLMAG
jgi:hypothetical protein